MVGLPVDDVVLGVDVVVVVDEVPVVDVVVLVGVTVAGDGLIRLFRVVPVSDPPNIADNGLPEISSTAVMNMSASTNTMTAVPAMAPQEKRRVPGRRAGGCGGVVVARRRSVSPSCAAGASIRAVSVPDRPTTSVGADASPTEDAASPLAPVPPSLRNSVDGSGARTTTCFTARWPCSIDWATNAVAMVAAAEPIATPTMVPLTPKLDAMTAAITAPAAEARIWRIENFTPGLSSRPRGARRRGQ